MENRREMGQQINKVTTRVAIFDFSKLTANMTHFSSLSEIYKWFSIYPYHTTGLFLQPQKTSKNLWFLDFSRSRNRPNTCHEIGYIFRENITFLPEIEEKKLFPLTILFSIKSRQALQNTHFCQFTLNKNASHFLLSI